MSQEKNALLHSRYNPQAEADRYIAALALDEKARFFILIEPGLGYLIAPLRKRSPNAKIIALHADANAIAPDAEKAPALSAPDSRWHHGAGLSLQDFLEREIPDTAAAEIRILEWRPALAIYGDKYLRLVTESAEFIKRADANARTINAFGRRWFKNFFRNLEIIRSVIRPAPFSQPVLVAGSGPSLEDAIPLIKESAKRGSLFVLAVSSSVPALRTAGVSPNMVITSDGGQWARFHLFDIFRAGSPYPLAAALTAALPSQCAALPVLPISDGSLWQTVILSGLAMPFIALPQRGTVSASALDMALNLTSGDIFIAGLDLENSGIRSHARPYSLDRFIEEKAGRLNPVYSQAFKRAALLKAGGSFGIYASWFEKQLASYPRRLYSLGKNNRVFDSLGKALLKLPEVKAAPLRFSSVPSLGTGGVSAAKKAYGILEKALSTKGENSVHKAALHKELGQLLLGTSEPSSDELIETLRLFKKES